MVGAVVGAGLGGAATFFYLRHQQQQAAPAKPRAAEFAPPGAAKPMFKYGERGWGRWWRAVGMHAFPLDQLLSVLAGAPPPCQPTRHTSPCTCWGRPSARQAHAAAA